MKKMLVRAAVLAVFTAGFGTTAAIVGTGTAMACEVGPVKSWEYAASLPQVNYGDHNEYVMGLQIRLRGEGYDLQGTGTYADKTLAAVKDYQRKKGINPSGIVGSKTWAALVGPMDEGVTGNGKRKPPTFSVNPGDTDPNKIGALFEVMQRIYPYYVTGLPDANHYDAEWQSVVQGFQRRAGINPSGIIGPKTWAALYTTTAISGGWGC
jgi:peptidoglycan hydrolase-like protein with peptidoglycan-binding domain